MSVYVDDGFCGPPGSWGKWTGGGHMQADTPDELHAFAARLGLKRSWFQPGSRPAAAHYDLTESKRRQALALGAVSETWREASRRRHPRAFAPKSETGVSDKGASLSSDRAKEADADGD